MWVECTACGGDGTGCTDPDCLCDCTDCGSAGGWEFPDTDHDTE
nr:hypothetical protein GCM10017745_17990 [Saccharothrix mutabilis subsp. capreolus]